MIGCPIKLSDLMTETREQFIDAATAAFAEGGFYGTSIANIADALPFTKQALLHHFGSKEKLYGEVLKRISNRLMKDIARVADASLNPRDRFEQLSLHLYRSALEHSDDTQLLMRELLDNRRRAGAARTWYLKPFLQQLTDLVLEIPGADFKTRDSALAFVYQLLGAINYFAVSESTLTRMLGKRAYWNLQSGYEVELRRLITDRLDA